MASPAQKQASAARRARNRARGRARGYPRVRARPILAGRSAKTTRRCLGRTLLISPGKHAAKIANFIGYCLAHAAAKYGIAIHASVWMSNHHHTDLTDPDGNLVPFKQLLHSTVARGLNALRKRNGTFWGGGKPCDTRRSTDDDSLGDLVYTLTNPVKDGLVKWARLWPAHSRRRRTPSHRFDPKITLLVRPAAAADQKPCNPSALRPTTPAWPRPRRSKPAPPAGPGTGPVGAPAAIRASAPGRSLRAAAPRPRGAASAARC
ncbi:MAG: hypothetical protein R6X02_24310 [Enhygromyxa sp.]